MLDERQIKTSELVEMLFDHDFYLACPEYFFMRRVAIETIRRWKEQPAGFEFAEQQTASRLRAPLETFIYFTLEYQEVTGVSGPKSVVRYLQETMGYQEAAFVVYYKRGKHPQGKLLFCLEQGGSDGPRYHAESTSPVEAVRPEPRGGLPAESDCNGCRGNAGGDFPPRADPD